MEQQKIIQSLSSIERKVLPCISGNFEDIGKIIKQTEMDKTGVLRALEFLKKKKLTEIKEEERKIIDLDLNGLIYIKKNLPERRLLNELIDKKKDFVQRFEKNRSKP